MRAGLSKRSPDRSRCARSGLPAAAHRLNDQPDTYGYLITNLLKEESSLQELKELYLMRLSIKNAFLILKYTIGMLFFHSKKRQLIKQEIYVFIFYSVTLIFKERYSI